MTAPVARRGFTETAIAEIVQRRNEPEWMRERRLDAWKTYQQIPMPTRQDEEWRRTDLRALKLDDVEPYAEGSESGGTLIPETERDEQFAGVFTMRDAQPIERRLDGALAQKGVIFTDLATAVREHSELVQRYFMTEAVPASDSKFAALHGAFWDNGVFLYVPRGVTIEAPFRAIIQGSLDGNSSLAHTLVVLEEGSMATFVEDFASPLAERQGFSSRVAELILKQGANLRYVGVQRWGQKVYDFHTERVLLGKDSTCTLLSVELGSELSKGRVEAVLRGDGANAKLLGLYVEDGKQHLDRYTLQDHRAASGTSDLLYKGVLTDKSRSVFSGLIRVGPTARQTAAYQQNRNLLVSRTARADSIPNLEIGCNDILGCTHGATVGKVDEEQVFYLMCRGLTRENATRLIVEGFVDPLVEQIPVAGLRESIRRVIAGRIGEADR